MTLYKVYFKNQATSEIILDYSNKIDEVNVEKIYISFVEKHGYTYLPGCMLIDVDHIHMKTTIGSDVCKDVKRQLLPMIRDNKVGEILV